MTTSAGVVGAKSLRNSLAFGNGNGIGDIGDVDVADADEEDTVDAEEEEIEEKEDDEDVFIL